MISDAWLSKKVGSKILCRACSHLCRLQENEYGICGVRKVENGTLKLMVYANAAALNLDPIEKKPLFHFLPGSTALSIGTVGCNFACSFCQNYDISQFPKDHKGSVFGKKVSPDEVIRLAKTYGAKSIAYTYNEPAVFFEYAYDCAVTAKKNGLKNIFVTSGYETHPAIDTINPYLDALNIDLKSFSDKFYQKLCKARLAPVLNCIKYAYGKGLWIELTTLLIPEENDSDEEIRSIAQFIADIDPLIPWHLSAFFPTYKLTNRPPTPAETMLRGYRIAKEEGLKNVYVGNLNDSPHESTYCPVCSRVVIKRNGHIGNNVDNMLQNGKCPFCGSMIAGIWQN